MLMRPAVQLHHRLAGGYEQEAVVVRRKLHAQAEEALVLQCAVHRPAQRILERLQAVEQQQRALAAHHFSQFYAPVMLRADRAAVMTEPSKGVIKEFRRRSLLVTA